MINTNALINAIRGLSVSQAPRRRGGRRGPARTSVPRAAPVVVAPPSRRRKVKRKKNSNNAPLNPSDGSVRLKRCELLSSLKTNASGTAVGSAPLTVDSFPWLKTVAKAFEQVTWHSCRIYYKSYAGAVKSGVVAYGIDWNSNNVPNTRAGIQSLTPTMENSVWTNSQLVLPSSRLQSRKAYLINANSAVDNSPATVAYIVESDVNSGVAGDLWIEYDLTLFGTTA